MRNSVDAYLLRSRWLVGDRVKPKSGQKENIRFRMISHLVPAGRRLMIKTKFTENEGEALPFAAEIKPPPKGLRQEG